MNVEKKIENILRKGGPTHTLSLFSAKCFNIHENALYMNSRFFHKTTQI